ncbi:MAG: hypothetical protein JRF35_02605 [Deltaproteobacteria bacterium]|nr:hypothetical protein [Deltaproteobacteria bacterium]
MKKVILLFAILANATIAYANEPIEMRIRPEQDIKAPFRVFDTKNIYTKIALDTITGRVYQVHFATQSNQFYGILPINESSLLTDNIKAQLGRFTLYETDNMYNFILVDQIDGRFWQVQWSYEKDKRFIIYLPFKKE